MMLKLGLNSLYGKMCQRVGSAPWNNFIWSSSITAFTRAQVQQFIHSLPACEAGRCGDDVHTINTDGLFCSALPDGFTPSEELGGWNLKPEDIHPNGIFVVQPGVYFGSAVDSDGHRILVKTRGLPRNKAVEHEDDFREAFRQILTADDLMAAAEHHTVEIRVKNFVGMRLARARKQPDLVRQWKTERRKLSFAWSSKRRDDVDIRSQSIRTFPFRGGPNEISVPYTRGLADELDMRSWVSGMATADLADWADYLGPMHGGF